MSFEPVFYLQIELKGNLLDQNVDEQENELSIIIDETSQQLFQRRAFNSGHILYKNTEQKKDTDVIPFKSN